MSISLTHSFTEVVFSYGFNRYNDGYGDTLEEMYNTLDVSGEKPPKEEFIEKVKLAFPKHLRDEIRRKRNLLLEKSDWTQNRDVELANNDEWVTYRQELRDLPATMSPEIGKDIDEYFPSPP